VDETLAAALRKVEGAAASSGTPQQAKAVATMSDQPAPGIAYTRTSKVSLTDLDLTTPEGARVARERLHQEARRLCLQVADSEDLSHQTDFVACVYDTLAKAMRQLATPALVAGAAAESAPPASHPYSVCSLVLFHDRRRYGPGTVKIHLERGSATTGIDGIVMALDQCRVATNHT